MLNYGKTRKAEISLLEIAAACRLSRLLSQKSVVVWRACKYVKIQQLPILVRLRYMDHSTYNEVLFDGVLLHGLTVFRQSAVFRALVNSAFILILISYWEKFQHRCHHWFSIEWRLKWKGLLILKLTKNQNYWFETDLEEIWWITRPFAWLVEWGKPTLD